MYSYSMKHNESNGWNNTDGSNDNRSWNCGTEGETDDPDILALRRKLAQNAITVLLTSRGTPMFLAGDEFLNTQYGNNNAYCQDNEVSWLDWDFLVKNKRHFAYTKYMIQFRKDHDVVRKYAGNCSFGLPEIQILKPDGRTHVLCVVYAGRNRDNTTDDIVCLAVNVFWEEQDCFLPELPVGMKWQVEADTSGWYLPENIPGPEGPLSIEGFQIRMAPRSTLVLTLRPVRIFG